MVPKIPVTALAAAAAILVAAPARADEVTSLLEQATYYMQLSTSSLDLATRVSARKEKCQWARQSRGELAKALEYYDAAERRAATNPSWSAADREKLSQIGQKGRDLVPRAEAFIREVC